MSDVSSFLWLIPVLPGAAAAVIALFGPRLLRNQSHWPCILAFVASFILSVMVLVAVYRGAAHHPEKAEHAATQPAEPDQPKQIHPYYSWFEVGTRGDTHALNVWITLRADALSAMMLVMVTFIATLIAIYSIGYMHADGGYARFFAEVSLFVFMMTTLVLADNFLLLYLGWEGVGLCSYLLVGFWFAKPAAAAAARKAFLVTRIGDTGLMIGILLIWVTCNWQLDYDSVFRILPAKLHAGEISQGTMVAVCLLLFCGAVGKSAQFPLHVWLPDAMEGPTPVSALIHAATMVTAGVYLVARCTPLFQLAPEAQLVVAGIGAFTAILAASIALTQNDLKRVLAYSTLSQLGYMFLALGCGVRGPQSLVTFAVIAGMFHLFTHAFFKALLFMSAGSVMHAMGGVIDMRRFSGLRKVMPKTHWTFLCGALALSGFPFLSGFWSKDDVLAAAWGAGGESSRYGAVYYILWASGMITAFMTAFYTFRAYFQTFWGEERIPHEAGHHAHESPAVMTVPLMVLSVFALGVGFVLGPLVPAAFQFSHFLGLTPGFPSEGEHGMKVGLMVLSGALALCGIGLAYLMYVKQPDLPKRLASSAQGLYQLSLNKFHFDELYDTFILKPLHGVTMFCRIFDQYVIDGLVDLIGHVPRLLGFLFRPVQNGLVQFYALAMILGLTVFLLALARSL